MNNITGMLESLKLETMSQVYSALAIEAEKNKKDPKVFCDELSKNFNDLTKILNLSNDDFIRTTEKRHYKSVEEIWKRLVKS